MANKEEGSFKDLIPLEGQDKPKTVPFRMKKISLEDHSIQDHHLTQPNYQKANNSLLCMAIQESQWGITSDI